MQADVNAQEANETNKNHTLKALFGIICEDHEFTLLRRTLELYCEEIAKHDIH